MKLQAVFFSKRQTGEGIGVPRALIPVGAIVAAMAVSAVLLLLLGTNPLTALRATLDGAFGTRNNLGTTLAKTAPLLIAGVGITVALRAGLYNIGAEGQIYIGGLFTAWIILGTGVTGPLALVLGLLAGGAAGFVWCGAAGWLKARRGMNEVITTLLLNYVAIQIVLWAVSGPMKEPGATFPRSADIPRDALLPKLIPNTQGHIGILLGIGAAVLAAYTLKNTSLGYKLRALEPGHSTAQYAGLPVQRLTVLAMGLSGALAGVAGSVEVLGVHRRLIEGFSPGYGFDAIAVALLARGRPLGVIPAAFFFGTLRSGANAMQRATGVPSSLVFVVQATAVLFLVAGLALERARARASERMSASSQAPSEPVEVTV